MLVNRTEYVFDPQKARKTVHAVTVVEAKQNLESLIAQVVANAEPMIVSTDTRQRIVLETV